MAEELDGDGTYANGEENNWVIESESILSDSEIKETALTSFRQRHHAEEEWMCSSYSYNFSTLVYSMLVAFTHPSMGRYHSTFYRLKIAILA